jgi:hypothetical protein
VTSPESATHALLEHIIDLEWTMFHSVKASEPAACQEDEGTFRLMRWMSHSIYPIGLLEAMAANLEGATAQGRNLMTEKYARMADQIPPLKASEHFGPIVAAELGWMEELNRRYPLTFPGSGEKFRSYLAADLETWSDEALEQYAGLVRDALAADRNLVAIRYRNLFRRLGYPSIEAREQQTRMQMFKCCQ